MTIIIRIIIISMIVIDSIVITMIMIVAISFHYDYEQLLGAICYEQLLL